MLDPAALTSRPSFAQSRLGPFSALPLRSLRLRGAFVCSDPFV